MTEFYNNMCAEELMWLIRIILKQMKVGATESTFFDAWHPDSRLLFGKSSSLRRVCWDLWDPNFRLNDDEGGVLLMSCFQPQLAQFQKKDLSRVVKAMQESQTGDPGNGTSEEFWVEEKLDGERIQMHYDHGEFKWWSRKAKEYTHLYGSSCENGSLARFTKGPEGDTFNPRVTSIILDGEMITWDPKLDAIVGFGTLKTAAIETCNNPFAKDQNRPLFRVFDILYLNGNSLIDYTLEDRRKALEGAVNNVHRRLEIHPYTAAKTAAEIESELRKVIATASEGLVIKNPRSVYQLNDRNDDWVKVKPEYMTEYGESLDCLVVGGYWGSGKRGNVLSSYLCGLRVDGPGGEPVKKFYSFFKVGGGFAANDYATIAHQTEGSWIEWLKSPPDFIELAGGLREFERPDVYIHPENSFVVEVKAASVASTDQFRTGMTLRFPRFKKVRPDKNWKTALSVQGFLRLKAEREGARDSEHKKLDVEKGRGGSKRIKKEYKLAGDDAKPQFAIAPVPAVGKPLFEGHSFYIMSESASKPKKSKAEIESLVKTHGGKFFQNEKAGGPRIHVIGDRNTVKISALKKKVTNGFADYDIVRPAWIFDCIRQNYLLPLEPCHIFHATDKTAKAVLENVDAWEDSYARDIDVEDLRKLLGSMQGNFDRSLALPFRSAISGEECGGLDTLPGWMFKDFVVYIDETAGFVYRPDPLTTHADIFSDPPSQTSSIL